MITEKTVFILGAGASCPYGFQSGAELRRNICLNFADKYSDFLRSTNSYDEYRVLAYRTFAGKFFESSTKSIDLFLARRPDFAEMGKYVIAFEMINAEANSKFNEQSKNEGREDWMFYLFDKMTDIIKNKTQINKFLDNNISFITFNYDRSLEHFFFTSLRSSFDVAESDILNILRQLKIIHVYGSLSPLNWQDGKNGIQYGQKTSEWGLQNISQNLRTIYEELQNPELDEAKKLIAEAKKVFFLGFGYAPENMEILGLPGIISPDTKIYGTTFGFEANEINKVHKKIVSGIISKLSENEKAAMSPGIGMHVKIENMDCLKLLRNYL